MLGQLRVAKRKCGNLLNMLNVLDQTELAVVAVQKTYCSPYSLMWSQSADELHMSRKQSQKKTAARRGPKREISRSLPMALLRAREEVVRQIRPPPRDY